MTFTNLAGGRHRSLGENDKQICRELARCGIDMGQWDCGDSEVRTNNCGVLGPSRFYRAWTYWTFTGRVPLAMAQRLYEHPVGFSDIRVAGHACCPAPEDPWIQWRDLETGKKYARTKDQTDIEKWMGEYPDMYAKFIEEHLFHDDPESVGAIGTIDSYHIDTEIGLYVFVQFLKGAL